MLTPFTSKSYRQRTAAGFTGDECCICGKPTSGMDGAIHVPIDHERNEFVTDVQAAERGQAVSLYPIGPECAKKWSKEFAATSNRFRRARGKLVAYDEQASR